jgi:hypothetical protein
MRSVVASEAARGVIVTKMVWIDSPQLIFMKRKSTGNRYWLIPDDKS